MLNMLDTSKNILLDENRKFHKQLTNYTPLNHARIAQLSKLPEKCSDGKQIDIQKYS